MTSNEAVKVHVIPYTVNDLDQETTEHELTPNQIMTKAGLNPDENYLVEIKGRHRESYEGKADDPIHMHPHQRFVTVFTGTVPVS